MSKHTAGPWKYCPPVLDDESGFVGAKAGDGHGVTSLADRPVLESAAQFEANAARIVACVNACEGMDDPEAFVEAAKHITRELTDGILAHGLSSDQRELLFSLVWAAGGRR
jgi:hypothetical protein